MTVTTQGRSDLTTTINWI